MLKKFKTVIIVFSIICCVSLGIFTYNNKDNMNNIFSKSDVANSSKKINLTISEEENTSNNKDIITNKNTSSNNNPTVNIDNNIDEKYSDINNSNIQKSDNTNNSNDYTVAVSSSMYNALVSLDKDKKEINIKLLDENTVKESLSDRYIHFSDSEIKYLLSNSNELLNEFKSGSIFDKYDMVKKMLSEYDTNIKESDLISLAFAYLK